MKGMLRQLSRILTICFVITVFVAPFENGIIDFPGMYSRKALAAENNNDLEKNSVFGIDKLPSILGNGKNLPVFYDDNIKIDGSLDDWGRHDVVNLPSNDNQYHKFQAVNAKKTFSADFYAAYDDDAYYVAIRVKDDLHFPTDTYWQGDSVQIAFGNGKDFGPEIGFQHTNDNKSVVLHPSEEKAKMITLVSSRKEGETIYEARLPWGTIYDKKPDKSFLFSFLVNNNDGKGRDSYLEWTPGIGSYKGVDDFVQMDLLPKGEKLSSWIVGPRKADRGSNNQYSVYIVNYDTVSHKYKLSIVASNLNENIEVGANSGLKINFPITFPDVGDQSIEAILSDEAETVKNIESKVFVAPDLKYMEDIFAELTQQKRNIAKLLSKCKAKGISTEYETVNYTVIKDFIQYAKDDMKNNRVERAIYVVDNLNKLVAEAVNNLQAYLDNTKKSISVPRFVSGDVKVDGYSFIGKTQDSQTKKEEIRPIIFTGYGHFQQAIKDIPNFSKYGNNIIQTEVATWSVLADPDELLNWGVIKLGGIKTNVKKDSTVFRSGKSSLNIQCATNYTPNVYQMISQTVAVQPNTTYDFKAYAKAEDASYTSFTKGPDYNFRQSIGWGTFDWKQIDFQYTTGPDEKTFQFIILTEGPIQNLWIDDISMVKDGTDDNLLSNADFEKTNTIKGDFGVTYKSLENGICKVLKDAEDNNIKVDLALATHYFPEWMLNKYPDLKPMYRTGFFPFDIYNPKAKEIVELYLRELIPIIKGFKSINSLCLSNEPQFDINSVVKLDRSKNTLIYKAWANYLEKTYTSIYKLNRIYGERYKDFSKVPLPKKTASTPQFYDWMIFNNQMFMEWHKWTADIIHEIAPEIRVETKQLEGGLTRFSKDEALRWGVDPESLAEFCELNGTDAANFYNDNNADLIDKLKWYDLLASIKIAPIVNSEDHVIMDRNKQYIPQQLPHVLADLWQGAIHGRNATILWVWERTYDSAHDFEGSVLHRPDVVAGIGKSSLDLNRLSYEVTALQNETSKVGILFSNPSRVYSKSYFDASRKAYESIIYNGQRAGFITEKQLASGKFGGLKMIVIPQVTNVLESSLAGIKAFIEAGGKVLIIGNQSLSKNEHNQDYPKEDLEYIIKNSKIIESTIDIEKSIISSPTSKELQNEMFNIFNELNLNKVMLIDRSTNKPVNGVEWRSTQFNGKTLVNICNYDWKLNKDVDVFLNGKKVINMQELITESSLNEGQIVLKPYQPILVEIDNM